MFSHGSQDDPTVHILRHTVTLRSGRDWRWEEMMKKRPREYFYLPIADAVKSVSVKVNLLAVIDHVAPPYLTSSSDVVVKFRVVDPTYTAVGVIVICSADTNTKLPDANSAGDIISLHHVVMNLRDGEHYCVYDKRYSSFAIFHGTTSENVVPYSISEKYTATEHGTVLLKQIRDWSRDRKIHEVITEYPLKLMNINPCAVFDLVCKVINISKTSSSQVLYAWDGTDAPPGLQLITSSHQDQRSTLPVPLQLEETPLPRDTLCSFPCVGTVLRVFTSKNPAGISKLRDHERPWVQLCNLTCTMHTSGIWEGFLQPFSKIQILPDQDNYVIDCLRDYDSRINKPAGRYPWMCHPSFSSITVTNHPSMQYSTLMESLTNTKADHLIKVIVRVVDVDPPECSYKEQDEVRLTLEDPTARIHAFLMGKHAENFFGGESEEVINRKMKSLLGLSEWETEEGSIVMQDAPWSIFCLKSCLQKGPSGSQKYIIQDTSLLKLPVSSQGMVLYRIGFIDFDFLP